MGNPLDDVVIAQKAGRPVGITSVCSADPLVLRAAVDQAVHDGSVALIEATSNQVDQDGGYTGMRPVDFADLVYSLATEAGLPFERIVLGGDHLGPNTWRSLPAAEAMDNADELVRDYVRAGFTKIHLDCTYPCADDDGPLGDDVVAARAARMLAAAEEAAPDPAQLRYVIGTEVPVPGGAHETIDILRPTSAGAARTTLAAHRAAFADVGHAEVWPRVMALVVQPGVEFDHVRVVDYVPEATTELQTVLDAEPHMVFEAHSTDYQTLAALSRLVADHWAVLKVGPGLTFALREALFALAGIEAEVVPSERRAGLPEVLEQRMLAEPRWWRGYYSGSADEQRLARRFSYSDRIRYYWPDPDVEKARAQLLDNLGDGIGLPLLSQFLPDQYARVRSGELYDDPRSLVEDRVRDVLRGYARACSTGKETR